MPQTVQPAPILPVGVGPSFLPIRPNAADRRACLIGRSVAYIPGDAPLVTQLRRNYVGLDDPGKSHVADLYLAENPLPLETSAVAQRGAFTFLTGLSAPEVLLISPPSGCVALAPITYLPTGSHRVADPASAAQWRACGCFDVGLAPAELLGEALALLGLDRSGTSGSHDAERRRLDACLQSDADAAGQLFGRWRWLHLIKHRLQLRGLDRSFHAATVTSRFAARSYTQLYGTDFQVPYSRTLAKDIGPDWRH